MDATDLDALSRARENLAGDLEKVSQFIEPQNQQALATLYRAQRRLEDIVELAKCVGKTTPTGESGHIRAESTNESHLRQIVGSRIANHGVLDEPGSDMALVDNLNAILDRAAGSAYVLGFAARSDDTIPDDAPYEAAYALRDLIKEAKAHVNVWFDAKGVAS